MATFHCHFKSKLQDMHSSFNVIIPEHCTEDVPVVYLLHGIAGDENNWPRFTGIERYATERSLAIVMPGVGKHFYSDVRTGSMDYSYINELMAYCQRIFPLSKKREKTFIAGLSMGGYGALKFALGQNDRFAACASLSGSVDLCYRVSQQEIFHEVCRDTWGENYLRDLPGSEHDLYELVHRLEAAGGEKPWVFQSCGTEDFLYEDNQRFKEFMDGRSFVYEYHEGPGAHTWDVWDYWIVHALNFFRRYMKEHCVEEQLDLTYTQAVNMAV